MSIDLKLYVTGRNRLSDRAQKNLRKLTDLLDSSHVEVVDILEEPDVAESNRIVATPLLVRVSPKPEKRIFGDLSDVDVLVTEMGLIDDGHGRYVAD